MKKMIWIVVGVIVLSLLVVQLTRRMAHGAGGVAKTEDGRQRSEVGSRTTEDVLQASSLPLEGQVAGGTGQGLQNADVADGQAGSATLQLSDPVKALLGLDGEERNYSELLAEIHKLGVDLSDADVAALRELLKWPNDRFPAKMRPIEINAVKNDVLDKLLRQEELSAGLGIQIAEMAGNADNDSVWRDYCVQFMEPYYEKKLKVESLKVESEGQGRQDAGDTEDELTVIHDAMFSALDERSDTIAGTALIGLELLSRTQEEFDREQIVEKAVEIASDWQASPASRLTALRLASQTSKEQGAEGLAETVEVARTLAQTGETVLLRSAAIVTLGETGSEEDRELLESFTLSENKQIAAAARLVLDKMDAKAN